MSERETERTGRRFVDVFRDLNALLNDGMYTNGFVNLALRTLRKSEHMRRFYRELIEFYEGEIERGYGKWKEVITKHERGEEVPSYELDWARKGIKELKSQNPEEQADLNIGLQLNFVDEETRKRWKAVIENARTPKIFTGLVYNPTHNPTNLQGRLSE